MTEFAALPADAGRHPGQQPDQDDRPAPWRAIAAVPAAVSILDRLDTRPLEVRLRRRPWWRFW